MPEKIISFAQNGEDIVLWRALSDVAAGRYLEVGANDPVVDSITKLFYDRGWSGVTVEPVPEFAERHRAQRPRDTHVQAAVTDSGAEQASLHVFAGTGLSTLDGEIAVRHARSGLGASQIDVQARSLQSIVDEHLDGEQVHFCVIDVEGAEAQVLRSVDLSTVRPWVLVIEATKPRSTEATHEDWEAIVLDAGYTFCLFDGLSRFYVADEHLDLKDKLSYAASAPVDDFVTSEVSDLRSALGAASAERDAGRAEADALRAEADALRAEADGQRGVAAAAVRERDQLRAQVVYWRGQVLASWSRAAAQIDRGPRVDPAVARELEAIRQTVSWRVTAPLRTVRRRLPGGA